MVHILSDMKRIRDAENGEFISREQAEKRDKSTWIEQEQFDKGKFLQKIFDTLFAKSSVDSSSKYILTLDEIEDVFSQYNYKISINNTFINNLKRAIKDLTYISETDSDVSLFLSGKVEANDAPILLKQIGNTSNPSIREVDFDSFFDNLVQYQKEFANLRKLLETHLTDLKVFKVGDIEIDIYIVGISSENNLIGISTKAIET